MSTLPGFHDTLTRNMENPSISISKEFGRASNGDSDSKFDIGFSKDTNTTEHQNDKITYKSIGNSNSSSAEASTQKDSSKNANYKFSYRYG